MLGRVLTKSLLGMLEAERKATGKSQEAQATSSEPKESWGCRWLEPLYRALSI